MPWLYLGPKWYFSDVMVWKRPVTHTDQVLYAQLTKSVGKFTYMVKFYLLSPPIFIRKKLQNKVSNHHFTSEIL